MLTLKEPQMKLMVSENSGKNIYKSWKYYPLFAWGITNTRHSNQNAEVACRTCEMPALWLWKRKQTKQKPGYYIKQSKIAHLKVLPKPSHFEFRHARVWWCSLADSRCLALSGSVEYGVNGGRRRNALQSMVNEVMSRCML